VRQENHKFETSLGYIVRPCLNKTKQTNKNSKTSKKNEYLGIPPIISS
jgi:hypothetical protein